MFIDPVLLSTTIVSSFLLPYIKMGSDKLVESIGQTIGKTAAEHAVGTSKKIWERLKGVFNSEEDKTTFALFEKRPDAARALMEEILKDKLAQDRELAKELSELVNAPGPDGISTGAQIINASIAGIADARNANFNNASGVQISGVTIDKNQEHQNQSNDK